MIAVRADRPIKPRGTWEVTDRTSADAKIVVSDPECNRGCSIKFQTTSQTLPADGADVIPSDPWVDAIEDCVRMLSRKRFRYPLFIAWKVGIQGPIPAWRRQRPEGIEQSYFVQERKALQPDTYRRQHGPPRFARLAMLLRYLVGRALLPDKAIAV